MKNINIGFADFYDGFNPVDNKFYHTLTKHYDVNISSHPDFLFYSCFGSTFQKYNNCIKIFWTGENVRPNFNECDYAIGFDFISFEDRYIRETIDITRDFDHNINYCKRKFCNFIYSNATIGSGAIIRQDFCKLLSKYKHIDCPGKVLNNMKDAIEPRFSNWWKSKINFIKDYKFTIAFENSSANGYTTEKLYQPLLANSIPIYWGDPVVSRVYNNKSFINCHDFIDFNSVIEYIKFLDTNDDAYIEMLKQPPMNPNYIHENFEDFLIHIIENGKIKNDRQRVSCYGNPSLNTANELITNLKLNIIEPFTYDSDININMILEKARFSPTNAATYLSPIVDHMEKYIRPCNGRMDSATNLLSSLKYTTTPPPQAIPIEIRKELTMNGIIPIYHWYFDQRRNRAETFSTSYFTEAIEKINNQSFPINSTYAAHLKQALAKYPIHNQKVMIYGTNSPYIDALCLYLGAKIIYVVDLIAPKYEHPSIYGLSIEQTAEMDVSVDTIISINWVAHMGLGRYGDTINANGDIIVINNIVHHLNKDGLLFLSIPVGQDAIYWNAHRIYGAKRLPLLLNSFNMIDIFGASPDTMFNVKIGDCTAQPTLVLKR